MEARSWGDNWRQFHFAFLLCHFAVPAGPAFMVSKFILFRRLNPGTG
jgi:hypothetical protein